MSRTKLSFSLTLACVSVRTKSTFKLLLRNESQEWCVGICSPQFRHRFEACGRVQGRAHRSRAPMPPEIYNKDILSPRSTDVRQGGDSERRDEKIDHNAPKEGRVPPPFCGIL